MKVYKCDFCNKIKTCKHKDIEGKEYDVCAACWSGVAKKLKGKGRENPVEIAPWVPSVPWYPVYPQPYWYNWTITIPRQDTYISQPTPWYDTVTCGGSKNPFIAGTTGTYKYASTTDALDITPS